MLKIYWADFSRSSFSVLPPLSEYRKEKLAALRHERARRASLCAELLLIEALRREDPSLALPLTIAVDEYGKPYLPGGQPAFNLSHSAQAAACAISGDSVGVDIQILTKCRESLVRRFFAPGEQEAVLRSKDPDAAFSRLWTRKESWLKATGLGLRVDLDSFDLSGDAPSVLVGGKNYAFFEYRIGDLFLCACAPAEERAENVAAEEIRIP